MSRSQTTYRNLFNLLVSLGFTENIDGESERRTFVHPGTVTLLLFGRQPSDAVTSADMLSTEVHLMGNGLIDQPLESLIEAALVSG